MAVRHFIVMVCLVACGAEPLELEAEVSLPLKLPLVCPGQSALGAITQASLLVGGYERECALSVNPETLDASGQCRNFVPGTVRPLALVYEATRPDMTRVPLAYRIGFVDLCGDPESARVSFTLGAPGEALLMLPAELAALPDVQTPQSCDNGLDDSLPWAKQVLTAREAAAGADLDLDNDSLANLEEGCAQPSTLF